MTIDLRSLPQKITELDIGIADQKSGHLLFEKGSYHYAYAHADSLPVSVTMQPQNQRLYNNGRLFPIFEMNIPEGYVRHRIAERLLRYVGKVSDMLFLALQQDTGIGALSYQSGFTLPKPTSEKLEDLLKWNEKGSAFEYLLDKYLLNTSVSGVQPKVMLNADGKGSVLFPIPQHLPPTTYPDDHAHWKLYPPSHPVTSTTSPTKNNPGALFAISVFDESSRVSTPPTVTSAFL
jgi:serine/threonine-protein kinase HipA